MYKLLTANFIRLRRDILFWSCLLAAPVLAFCNIQISCRQAANGIYFRFEECFFNIFPFLGLVFAVFISFFLGTEYSDGAIRNKLVVGHTRTGIYAAHLLTCTAASLLFTAAAMLAGLTGMPVLGPFQMEPTELAAYLVLTLLWTAALASLCTLVGMLSTSKAGTVALSLFLCLGLLFFGSYLYNALKVPEMSSGVAITSEGFQILDPTPNPEYIGGTKRIVYEFLLNILPTGQGILMANLEVSRPLLNGAASLLIFAGSSLLGAALFDKKDLK